MASEHSTCDRLPGNRVESSQNGNSPILDQRNRCAADDRQKSNTMIQRKKDSTPGRVRTYDPRIKSPLLYQLSYKGGLSNDWFDTEDFSRFALCRNNHCQLCSKFAKSKIARNIPSDFVHVSASSNSGSLLAVTPPPTGICQQPPTAVTVLIKILKSASPPQLM